MSATVQYVYCVVSQPIELSAAPRGIDGAPARAVLNNEHPGLVALVSALDAIEYSVETISTRTDDPAWLTPRAIAHDSLLTWAADTGPVIPLPMWVMFHDDVAVSQMLAERATEFRAAIERVSGAREFGVRISGDKRALASAVEQMNADLARLEQQASTAPPGQAYLLRRKVAEARKIAIRDAASRIAEQAHESLAGRSRASLARATALANEPGVILDGAYLVANEDYDAFRSAITDLIATYAPAGLRFDFTGPW
ncbi:MAG TPA: GvpL/GvpF family gas vesicle protein, partial [Gemmatimonadaceae bacterium]